MSVERNLTPGQWREPDALERYDMGRRAPERPGWGWVAGVTAFIYLSLPVMPSVWNAMGRRTPWLLRGGVALLALLVISAVWIVVLVDRRERRPLPLSFLGLLTAVFSVGLLSVSYPSERIHFFEYGVLGMLILRSSLRTMTESRWASAGVAALVLTAAGSGDELIQHLLPNRFFDWHDIWFNVLGGALGFGAYVLAAPREGR